MPIHLTFYVSDCYVPGRKPKDEPLYRRGGRLAYFTDFVARVSSPALSPVVLRLHIFDIEPPSVGRSATKNIIPYVFVRISLRKPSWFAGC
jgi:hypothetical protein